jgi:hypothetical protein
MIDPKIVEVILQGEMPMVAGKMSKSGNFENVEYVPLHQTIQRLHDVGYRKVPTAEEVEDVLEYQFRHFWTDWNDSKKRFAQAIHDLMLKGGE